ncbi:MAG: M6 family metalloprotease domain-containing protein, partial [Peptococcaceae bacterium]|nr:M6 family metalloprotease domain-containing protein [Peptococcaceae bacterium]
MERPTPDEIAQYKLDGTFDDRVREAKNIGNQKTDPSLIRNLYHNLQRINMKERGLSDEEIERQLSDNQLPGEWSGGLPATGSPKALVILVDFPDYPHASNQTVNDVYSGFFGSGNSANAPYESLNKFYQRSSYQQLNITGNVLGWYRARYNRSYYENLGDGYGQEALIKEAVNYYNSEGHDFTQYDNDGDGNIEALFIKWTGPDNGWSGFWWAYQTSWYYNTGFTVDGKRINKYVWSWYNRGSNGTWTGLYSPRTDIHETGHLLGLPDYYDYDETVGPNGGVGWLDMMDSNWGDHNCFSKFLLGWINPTVIASGTQTKALYPSGSTDDAVLIMPGATASPYGEFFMAQYRKRNAGNDPYNYPADGMLIWHVDATLNSSGDDFLYDNSYTGHKLLRLMEADGLEEIEYGDGYADAGDFYTPPKTFTPLTSPNSNRYSGQATGVSVDNLTEPAATASARFGIAGSSGGEVTSVTLAADKTSPQPAGTAVTFTATATGSSNPVYQFWYEDPSGNWHDSGAYSSSNTFQLTNPVSGTYMVVAYAMDASLTDSAVASNTVQ